MENCKEKSTSLCVHVCVCVYVRVCWCVGCVCGWLGRCVLVLHPFIFHSSKGSPEDLYSECEINIVDFTDWMPFQPLILTARSPLITKSSSEIRKAIHQHGIAEKKKTTVI